MKIKPPKRIEKYRVRNGLLGSDSSWGNNGVFEMPGPNGDILTVIVSDGLGWDHVSVSTPKRTPTWSEMCFVKDIFFEEDEVVIQYHPAKKDYVNFYKYCLHMWRPQGVELPEPPTILVGPKI